MNTESYKPAISFSFSEGKYIDMWSIVHLCTGVLLGIIANILPFPEVWTFAGVVTLLVLWEMFESYMEIGEGNGNLFMDIIFGILGYVIAHILFTSIGLHLHTQFIIFAICTIIVFILDIRGIHAYKKRTKRATIRETVTETFQEKQNLVRTKQQLQQKNN